MLHRLRNIKGTLLQRDELILEFEIEKSKLITSKLYTTTKGKVPLEFYKGVVTKSLLDDFFNYRVVQDGSQDIKYYLSELGLNSYDIDEIIKKTNGVCSDDTYWVRFNDFGAQCYNDLPIKRP